MRMFAGAGPVRAAAAGRLPGTGVPGVGGPGGRHARRKGERCTHLRRPHGQCQGASTCCCSS